MVGRKVARRAIAAAILFSFGLLFGAGTASAEPTTVDVSDQPIIILDHTQALQIRIWDRPQILVDSTGEAPVVEKRALRRPARVGNDTSYPVPIPAAGFREGGLAPVAPGSGGDVTPGLQLGPEEFPVALPPGNHDTVRLRLTSAATITIPANTAILTVNGAGMTSIRDYHGQLIAQQRQGPLILNNVGGDAFVQNLRGGIYIADSSFDRLRARTGTQNMVFQRCNVKQIEASSVRGSILYDNGTFAPGLARFETVAGNIALGVNGGANIGVKGQAGQIYQSFDRPVTVSDRNGEATAAIGAGGPLVNVVTQTGKVFLYDGSMSAKRTLPAPWAPVRRPLDQIERRLHRAPAAPRAMLQQKLAQNGDVKLKRVLR